MYEEGSPVQPKVYLAWGKVFEIKIYPYDGQLVSKKEIDREEGMWYLLSRGG